jgi:hypothetical protein
VARAQRKSDSARSTGFPVSATDYEKLADVASELLSQLQQRYAAASQLAMQACRWNRAQHGQSAVRSCVLHQDWQSLLPYIAPMPMRVYLFLQTCTMKLSSIQQPAMLS